MSFEDNGFWWVYFKIFLFSIIAMPMEKPRERH